MADSHVLITGTGRAGTSFLYRFLVECGVPGAPSDTLGFDERARAGYEMRLTDPSAEYLVKDPWFFEYLDHPAVAEITLDAVIMPVRDLRIAAASRVRRERAEQSREGFPHAGWSSAGAHPGGVLYSLGLEDQERLLAVAQARVLAWCLDRQVPVHLLAYPRLVEDGAYVVDALSPWLLGFCTRDDALARHAGLVEPSSWDHEEVAAEGDDSRVQALLIELDANVEVNRELREQLAEAGRLTTAVQAQLDAVRVELDAARAETAEVRAEGRRLQEQLTARIVEAETAHDEIRALHSTTSYRLARSLRRVTGRS